MIVLRTYYLFRIREEVTQELKEKEFELFYLLKKLIQKQELPAFQISCYQQLCLPFPKEVLVHYFQEKYHLSHDKEIFHLPHETYQIRSSYLKVTTEKQIPSIFFLICHIDPHIFLCDFQNGDYFYLNDFYSQTKIKS